MSPGDQKRLARLDRIAELLDESIRLPVIGYRIGYDALIGLVPVVGDAAGLLAGTYLVLEAARFKVPRSTLLRMTINVALEAVIGSIPVLGDVFDATYKSNLRNLRLLHARLQSPHEPAPTDDRRFFVLLLLVPVLLVTALLLSAVILVLSLA